MGVNKDGALESPPGQQIVVAGKTTLKGANGIVVHTADADNVGKIVEFYNKWMGQLQDVEGLEFSVDVYEDAQGIASMLGIELPQ